MGFCSKCGAEYQENAMFCTKCGTRIADMGNKAGKAIGISNKKSNISSVEEAKNAATVILPISRAANKSVYGSDDKSQSASTQNGSSKKSDPVIKKNKALLILLIAAPVALIALVIIVGITSYFTLFSQSAKDRREVKNQLKLADRYLNELDYEQAVAAYKAVLEIDPNNAEALTALNDVYEKWAESEPEAADQIYADAISYYRELNERTSESTAADLITQLEQKRSDSVVDVSDGDNSAESTIVVDPTKLSLTIVGANETGDISGAAVTVSGSGFDSSAESDGSGNVSFEGLNDGNVKIKVSAPGFNSSEMNVSVSGDTKRVVALVPEISGDDAMVLITWNGDHDLDLCAFNSSIKEYVNIGHPMDSEGNVFLYADHGADTQYEVIYIHNASAEVARTFYITEADKARNGEPSTMEADGVSIFVYNSTGLVYSQTADTSQSAPLWCPCYYYAGAVYDQGDYIYDTTGEQYEWISFDEKDAYTADASATDDGWKQAYLELLNKKYYTAYPPSGRPLTASLIYVDGDSIPELAINFECGYCCLYTYSNGKIVTLVEFNEDYWEYDASDGDCIYYVEGTRAWYTPGQGLILFGMTYVCDGGSLDIIKWDGKNSTVLFSGTQYYGTGEDYFDLYVNGQEVSEEEFNSMAAATGWDGPVNFFDSGDNIHPNCLEDAKSYEEMLVLLSTD